MGQVKGGLGKWPFSQRRVSLTSERPILDIWQIEIYIGTKNFLIWAFIKCTYKREKYGEDGCIARLLELLKYFPI